MTDWQYASLVVYYLCWIALPSLGLIALGEWLDGNLRIRWSFMAQVALFCVGLTFTGQSQTRPLQAQQDHEQRLRDLERDTGDLRGKQNTHEGIQTQINSQILSNLEKMENRLDRHELEKAREIADIDARVKQNEQARTRIEFLPTALQFALTLAGVIAGLLGIRFIERRSNGRNGDHK